MSKSSPFSFSFSAFLKRSCTVLMGLNKINHRVFDLFNMRERDDAQNEYVNAQRTKNGNDGKCW